VKKILQKFCIIKDQRKKQRTTARGFFNGAVFCAGARENTAGKTNTLKARSVWKKLIPESYMANKKLNENFIYHAATLF
jgi:hypothetical protein